MKRKSHSNDEKRRRECPVCRAPVLRLVGDGCCRRCHRKGYVYECGEWVQVRPEEDYDEDE
jgi:hypothetical protein